MDFEMIKYKRSNTDDNGNFLISTEEIDWLIEQAEKVERMEMMYENTGAIFNRQHMKDKIDRYEKALKNISDKIKVGDRVSRTKTRKVILKPTDKKDVPFNIINIIGPTAIGEDGNNHFIKNLNVINKSK